MTWPSSLQSLTFGLLFNQSLDGVTWPHSLQSLRFSNDFNIFQPEFAEGDLAKRPPELNIWVSFQPEAGGNGVAEQPPELDLREVLLVV